MLKRVSSFVLLVVFSLTLLCSCKLADAINHGLMQIYQGSYSEAETSSVAATEDEQGDDQSDDKNSSSKKGNNTSSGKQNGDSLKGDSSKNSTSKDSSSKNNSSKNSVSKNNSSKKQSSSNQNASKNNYENKVEAVTSNKSQTSSSKSQTSSNKNEADNTTTTTSTKSESIKKNVDPSEALQIGAFHFNPKWTVNYADAGVEDEDIPEDIRIRELSDVLSAGYFNTFQVELDYAANKKMWQVCVQNDVSVWILLYDYYDSSKTTLKKYMAKVDEAVSVIKSNPEWWDNFCGFVFEESIWRGQTNEDFVAESEALYKKYGKRNHVVLATGEFTEVEGNEIQLGVSADKMKKILPSSFKYCTDVAFDSYGVDVRDGASNGGSQRYRQWSAAAGGNIYDGKSYYIEHTKLLVRLAGHDVNVWFYPCAYSTSGLWGGLNGLYRADEAYCLAHLNFFDSLLKEQEYRGGIILYTYTQFSDVNETGLQSRLVVKNSSGKQLIRPNESKWTKYSARLKELTTEYKKTEAKLAGGI